LNYVEIYAALLCFDSKEKVDLFFSSYNGLHSVTAWQQEANATNAALFKSADYFNNKYLNHVSELDTATKVKYDNFKQAIINYLEQEITRMQPSINLAGNEGVEVAFTRYLNRQGLSGDDKTAAFIRHHQQVNRLNMNDVYHDFGDARKQLEDLLKEIKQTASKHQSRGVEGLFKFTSLLSPQSETHFKNAFETENKKPSNTKKFL
jgi:hypothetical protein